MEVHVGVDAIDRQVRSDNSGCGTWQCCVLIDSTALDVKSTPDPANNDLQMLRGNFVRTILSILFIMYLPQRAWCNILVVS